MDYLSNYGYSSDEINCIVENIPSLIKSALILNQSVVCSNLEYLIKLGIKNYKEVFNTYYDMFLMDPTKFYEVFNKYDQDDLIDKLEKNDNFIETAAIPSLLALVSASLFIVSFPPSIHFTYTLYVLTLLVSFKLCMAVIVLSVNSTISPSFTV